MRNDNMYLISVAPLMRVSLSRDQSFFYIFSRDLPIGTLVTISVGKRMLRGIVTASSPDFPRKGNYEIKKISHVIEESYISQDLLSIAQFVSSYYICPLGIVLSHCVPQRVHSRASAKKETTTKPHHHLHTTRAQERIVEQLIDLKTNHSAFLHAPLAVEKISITTKLIIRLLHTHPKAQILYLTPEMMQIPNITQFFAQFFEGAEIAIMHGKMSKGEYFLNWKKVRSGQARLIIGTRKAIFAPFSDLHAIIIDESHDQSYKQWDHYPLYDARTVAREIATRKNCLLLNVSGTPRTIDYIHKSQPNKKIRFISTQNVPRTQIVVVDMKKERWEKNLSPISRTLLHHIYSTIQSGKQALIFVNQQGESAFSICNRCGMILKCPSCDRALIQSGHGMYRCTHCNYTAKEFKKCIHCAGIIQHVGIGTQKIAKELSKKIPTARIAIVDSSTMKNLNAYKKIYDAFRNKEIDIVIGTQMIVKNWSSGTMALSCIIDMDHLLCLPSFDVNERAFGFAMQLASRAHNGTLIIQTFQPDHDVITHARSFDFDGFHAAELALRRSLAYPPFAQIIKVLFKDNDRKKVDHALKTMHERIIEATQGNAAIRVSDPHYPLIDTIRKKHLKQIIIKNTDERIPEQLHAIFASCDTHWSIDIDPISLI